MTAANSYYVIAPINGLRMDFDYRIIPSHLLHMLDGGHSAELYGCPPNYKPHPEICREYRQPYEVLGQIPFQGYDKMIPDAISDVPTIDILMDLPDRKLKDFTCIAFQIDFDKSVNPFDDTEEPSHQLFKQVVERGESLLDPLRFCLFSPGKDGSMGSFGSAGNGIQCFWIGSFASERSEKNNRVRFLARKSLHYALLQEPIQVLEEDFGVIDADITFQGLCLTTFEHPIDRNYPYNHMLDILKHYRESREMPTPEARFRHLTSIAEDLAKIEEGERVSGNKLRDRIAQISTKGWRLYQTVNDGHPKMLRLSGRSYTLINERYQDMGWEDAEEAMTIIKDLWSNVRNPFSHSIQTFQALERDAKRDLANMEKVVVTMVNGWYAAYEMEGNVEEPAHTFLLKDTAS